MLYHVREVNKASQKSILIFILAIDDVRCNWVSAGCFFLVMSQVIMKLDPVGSTVRYEMMKVCAGSV